MPVNRLAAFLPKRQNQEKGRPLEGRLRIPDTANLLFFSCRVNNGTDGPDLEAEDIARSPRGNKNGDISIHSLHFFPQPSEAGGSMDRTGEAATVDHGFL